MSMLYLNNIGKNKLKKGKVNCCATDWVTQVAPAEGWWYNLDNVPDHKVTGKKSFPQ